MVGGKNTENALAMGMPKEYAEFYGDFQSMLLLEGFTQVTVNGVRAYKNIRTGEIIYASKVENKVGSLVIEEGGEFSQSEINAANYMKDLGNDVTLRMPQGTRAGGDTSDLLVNGVNYDVYTPETNNPNAIIKAMAKKNSQTTGIVLDLSKTDGTADQLGNYLERVKGAIESQGKVCNINDIVIMPK